jgi:hypothetical protein
MAIGYAAFDLCLRPTERAVTMMEENRRPRFCFRLRTLLFVIGILALLLVVVIQQVQISRQQAQIKQMRQELDSYTIDKVKLQDLVREREDQSAFGDP